jgi:cell wall-associated NlpC family hydrolase
MVSLMDEILKQQQQQTQPVAEPPPQNSWIQDLIAQRYQPKTERLKRSPQGFNFQREPFDPSSYYNDLNSLKNISHAATVVGQQEAMNRQAAEAAQFQSDRDAARNAVSGIGNSFGSSIGNAVGKASGKIGSIIAAGMKQLGKPYVFGDEGPNTFDCSGLMQFIFKKNGIKLPRTAAQQQKVAKRVSKPQPGDLVFYGYPAHHVALYLGNGKMLAAPHSGANVRVQPVYGKPTYGRI